MPHDLTRDVLDAEFERRSPERYRSLHRVIHDHVVAGIRATTGLDRQLLAQQLAYLHRRSPLTAAYYALRTKGSAAVVPARPEEYAQLVSTIEHGQGSGSAAIAERWFADQPDRTSVVRTEEGVAGFAYHIFCPSGSTMEDRDPVVRAVLDYVVGRAPPGPASGSTSPGLSPEYTSISATCMRCWPALCRRSSIGAPSRSPGRS